MQLKVWRRTRTSIWIKHHEGLRVCCSSEHVGPVHANGHPCPGTWLAVTRRWGRGACTQVYRMWERHGHIGEFREASAPCPGGTWRQSTVSKGPWPELCGSRLPDSFRVLLLRFSETTLAFSLHMDGIVIEGNLFEKERDSGRKCPWALDLGRKTVANLREMSHRKELTACAVGRWSICWHLVGEPPHPPTFVFLRKINLPETTTCDGFPGNLSVWARRFSKGIWEFEGQTEV